MSVIKVIDFNETEFLQMIKEYPEPPRLGNNACSFTERAVEDIVSGQIDGPITSQEDLERTLIQAIDNVFQVAYLLGWRKKDTLLNPDHDFEFEYFDSPTSN